MPLSPPSPVPPTALIDFRAPSGDSPPMRLAFGVPCARICAHSIVDVVDALAQAEAAARDGAWCVGYVRYEAAAAFDSAMRTHELSLDTGPLVQFLVYDAPLPAESAHAAWQSGDASRADVQWTTRPQRAPFDVAIARIHRAIAAGDVYQVNLTAPLSGRIDGDPLALFSALRLAQPNAYAAYIDGGADGETVLSVSPELFFDWRGGRLLASPMKGTAPRGATAEEDAALKAQLQASAKERAENLMIVDLLRNDMSRVSELFSVQVPRLFHAEAWPTVWQLTSDITSRTGAGIGLVDIFRALFPCGSVTGAPKVQAMRLIHELEPASRGVYCGAVGVIQPGGTATFNVPIRTVSLRGDAARVSIGSGITADADAADEWNEWRHKRAFVERASQAFELLETLRLSDGQLVNESRHLARMQRSAAHFGFAWRDSRVRETLDALVARHPAGHWRVRLLCDRHGALRAEAFSFAASDSPLLVQLAVRPMLDSDGEFIRHKTTRRAHYDAFAPASPEVFDTLLWNERGEITEFTRGNVALLIDGEWLTPASNCGLLPGVARAMLIDAGQILERVLSLDDLKRADSIQFFNSLRHCVRVSLRPHMATPEASSDDGQ